jgi:hypothetical protein
MKLALHPPSSILHTSYSILHTSYFPDLAPLDFYLFGYVKRCLAGVSFEDADQIVAAVGPVLEGIEKVSLQAVFLERMDRFRKCIVTNGEHIESAQMNVIEECIFIQLILRCSCPGGTPCIYFAISGRFDVNNGIGVFMIPR